MCAIMHFVVVVILFLIGRNHKNDSILDICCGFSFVIVVWMAYALTDLKPTRGMLVLRSVTIWCARLYGLGGDLRYQYIKDQLEGG